MNKTAEQSQALADAETARRDRQARIAEGRGMPPTEREHYLELLDGDPWGKKIAEMYGADSEEMKRRMLALPEGSPNDNMPIQAVTHDLSKDILAALDLLQLPMRNGVVIGNTHEPQLAARQFSTFNGASVVELTLYLQCFSTMKLQKL